MRASREAQEVVACDLTEVASSSQDALFSDIVGLDIDSQGRIYVSDGDKAGVTVLADDGAILRTVGRRGEGPGEFKWIRNVQSLPGDSLMVYDMGLGRITVFPPESDEVAYTINIAASSSLELPNWVKRLHKQKGFVVTATPPFAATGDDPSEDYNRKEVAHLLDLDGSVRHDSIVVMPSGQSTLIGREGRRVGAAPNPFGRPGVLQVGPNDRIYYGWGDSLAIEIYSPDGRQVGGFSMPHEPPPVTSQDLEIWMQDNSSKMMQNAMRERVPNTWPAFKHFVVDDQDRIWVGLLTPMGQPTEWVAFDDSGNRVCSAMLPENVRLELIRDGKAYGVATDELDVPRVVVYRIDGQQTAAAP